MTSHLSQKIFAAVALLALSSSSSASASATTYAKLGANGIVFSSTTNNSQSGSPSVSGPNGQSSNISTGAGGVVIGSGIAFVPSVGPVNLSAS